MVCVKPPKDKLIETPLAICWFDKDIFCVLPKEVDRNESLTKEHYKIIKQHVTEKTCWLIDMKICRNFDIGTRRVIENELPAVCKALAVLYGTRCEELMAALFEKAAYHKVPVKKFRTQKEAREWLKQF